MYSKHASNGNKKQSRCSPQQTIQRVGEQNETIVMKCYDELLCSETDVVKCGFVGRDVMNL
jgi:hypothetical protein